tara:strand:- start:202 stop:723 length:522 start_codon:yes stop_codon:yes gene_type:complete
MHFKNYIYSIKKNRMKKIIYILSIIFISSCSNNQVNLQNINEDATSFVESQFNFFVSSSIEEAKAVFADDAVCFFTDKAEYLKGWSEIEPNLIAQLEVIKDVSFSMRDLKITLSDDGTMASYTQIIDFAFSVNGEKGEIKDVRNTGVIKKINGSWKISHIHTSIGVEGQVVEY